MEHRVNTIDLNQLLLAGWRWIVVAAVAGTLLGALVGTQWPKSYEATAVLTIEPSSAEDVLNMETEQVVASSTAVQSRAAEVLGVRTGEVRSTVSVQVPRGAFALQFTATHSSPEQAAAFANAMAEAYGDQAQERVQEATTNRIETLVALIDDLEQELADNDQDSARATAVESRLTAAERELLDLELNPETGVAERGTLVSPAFPPTTPATPGWPVFAAGGLVAGLIIGVALVVAFRGRGKV
ncbi:Wzz/FepE/Etk N-terminal domain-containing protein [Ornithinimicrobium sediminis]|uniref:Wzz/FepE/Etk N-terminal domain-containing protein n=1 Tax=Ornithinimicrobium sediminis TaxID=2904603 RepID=UPI001E54B4A9|nr:Wzz/FepE/Etk N-terminal domain-containing protein [Ornithinimicrobium sediminis]MCE0486000.1 Wzz/FepE/Etk N-terminal domain-containing protein [Ornithinimicrobium sediminis]